MDDLQRSWYEMKFRETFRSRDGTGFQTFFSELMEMRYPGDFQRVKAYGRLGDHKCDGYHTSIKVVYQLYAPETFKLASMLRKIDDDFLGALEFWKHQMLGWRFVHNQWRGLPADVIFKLNSLQAKHKIPVAHWGEPEIRTEVFLLTDADITLLLGCAPAKGNVTELGFEDLRVVLEGIAQQPLPAENEIGPSRSKSSRPTRFLMMCNAYSSLACRSPHWSAGSSRLGTIHSSETASLGHSGRSMNSSGR